MLVTSTGLDELKIICDPFRHAESENSELMHYKCYDVLPLGRIPRGRWLFVMSFVGQGDKVELKLDFSRRANAASRKILERESQTFPVYFDNGTNSVQIGARNGGLINSVNKTFFRWQAVDIDAAESGLQDEVDLEHNNDCSEQTGPLEDEQEGSQWRSPFNFDVQLGEAIAEPGPARIVGDRPRGIKPTGSLMGRPRLVQAEHIPPQQPRTTFSGNRVAKPGQKRPARQSPKTNRPPKRAAHT